MTIVGTLLGDSEDSVPFCWVLCMSGGLMETKRLERGLFAGGCMYGIGRNLGRGSGKAHKSSWTF